jgi:hypothetical protein
MQCRERQARRERGLADLEAGDPQRVLQEPVEGGDPASDPADLLGRLPLLLGHRGHRHDAPVAGGEESVLGRQSCP